jgi:DNA mismatch repair protein MutS
MSQSAFAEPPAGRGTRETPMMLQFRRAKKEQPDALLFFRMGDFYELFEEDAVVASRELGIALTSRSKADGAIPMAGVPVKSVDAYLMKLVRRGHRVAICEQVEDPRAAKGLVDRAIVRVVTAGTLTEEDALDAREHNDLACVYACDAGAGLAWVDVSTGRFAVSEVQAERLPDEVARVQPAELVWPASLPASRPELAAELRRQLGPRISEREDWRFDRDSALRALKRHFKVQSLEGYGLADDAPVVSAAGALIEYLEETQRGACGHVRAIRRVESRSHLVLDRSTRACLELVRTQRDGRREGTLLETIDRCATPMGGRLLREWLLAPLSEVEAIRHRQQGVGELVDAPFVREELRQRLAEMLDVERLAAKVSTGRANPRDLAGLARSLALVPALRAALSNAWSRILGDALAGMDPLSELVEQIERTLVEAPPLAQREGGLVREGFSAELDELRRISGDGKTWMAGFQAEEAARTGINGLRIAYNSVFGYFIEVPRGQIARVPEHYVRKQTVKNCERYVTESLKEFEDKMLSAEERSRDLEHRIFLELREAVAGELPRILDTAAAIALLDVLAGLAETAAKHRYVAPSLDNGDAIRILDGRHPVIERLPEGEAFVPNDSLLNRSDRMVSILTGPNMAGKSTFIRQTALIVLMAQMGSYVPAREAKIGVVDRIFTRVGASDDIGRGASTFMVEMIEVANILNNATARSLVILDEVGRGTSTFDGLALAWAIAEHLHDRIGARTLFATHYHQLTDLAARRGGVHNLNVAVREWQDEIVFLHKIVEGGTDRSYGLHVARLAGVPHELVDRAREILRDLERDEEHLAERIGGRAADPQDGLRQLTLFAPPKGAVEEALARIDPERMTPIEALTKLKELKDRL